MASYRISSTSRQCMHCTSSATHQSRLQICIHVPTSMGTQEPHHLLHAAITCTTYLMQPVCSTTRHHAYSKMHVQSAQNLSPWLQFISAFRQLQAIQHSKNPSLSAHAGWPRHFSTILPRTDNTKKYSSTLVTSYAMVVFDRACAIIESVVVDDEHLIRTRSGKSMQIQHRPYNLLQASSTAQPFTFQRKEGKKHRLERKEPKKEGGQEEKPKPLHMLHERGVREKRGALFTRAITCRNGKEKNAGRESRSWAKEPLHTIEGRIEGKK